jgi:phosphoserine phosphatase
VELQRRGWTVMILSGGFRPAIQPLAAFLGIARVEAVDLRFHPDGSYAGYDAGYPTTRSGGKPEVMARLRRELAPVRMVMVGDGVSDLETAPEVDLFVGYGGYVARDKVRARAAHFITRLDQLLPILA